MIKSQENPEDHIRMTAEEFLESKRGESQAVALGENDAREFAGKAGLQDVTAAHVMLLLAAAAEVASGASYYAVRGSHLLVVGRKEK